MIATAFTLAMLAAGWPASASAHGGPQHGAELRTSALIAEVSPGGSLAFEVFIRSDGSDPFDDIHLRARAGKAPLLSAPDGCADDGAWVSCDLGALASGDTMRLQFVFEAPSRATKVKFMARLHDSPHHHRGGHHGRPALVDSSWARVVDTPDFFGTWQPAHAGTVTFTTDGIGGANGQSTTVDVPPVGVAYPAKVAEIADPIVCNGTDIGGFGQTVDLSIANGQPVLPHLTLTLKYAKSAIGWIDPDEVQFVHQANDGICSFPPRGCNTGNDGFCYDTYWTGSGSCKTLVIRVELPSNGRGRGF